MTKNLTELRAALGSQLKINQILSSYTTFKIGGPADYFVEVRTKEDMIKAVRTALSLKIPYFVLGGGSNILIADKGFRGLVIKNSTNQITIKGYKGQLVAGESTGEVYVEADSGVNFNQLVRFTIEEGLGGIEMHLGLPGTVGGAVYMNSKWGKTNNAIGDVIYQVNLIDDSGEVKPVGANYFNFSYDSSRIQKTGETVLSAIFKLNKADKDKLWESANETIMHRRETQPQGTKSAGCTFRNLSKAEAIMAATPNQTRSAGFLIDHAGLKGLSVGDAYISDVHANFIVNKGNAKADDVLKLIVLIKAKIHETYKVDLDLEIVKIGEF